MRLTGEHGTDPERGQATVEFLAVLPAVLLVTLVAWQLVVAGQAAWLAARAARSGSRALAVGSDPERAARSALPSGLRRGLRVETAPPGRVSVRLRVPIPLTRRAGPLTVRAAAAMEGR